MYLGTDKTKQPAQPIAKQNVPDARRFSQRIPCPYFTTEGRELTYQSSFFIKKSNRKERGNQNEFFHNSGNRIKDSRDSNRRRRGSMGRYQSA